MAEAKRIDNPFMWLCFILAIIVTPVNAGNNLPINGDCDFDCDVDMVDLALFAGQWLDTTVLDYDFNGDSTVNFEDFAVLGLNWSREFGFDCNKLSYGFAPPAHLYVIDRWGLTDEGLVLIQTLQGIVAQTKPEIFILENGGNKNQVWLDDMVDNYGVTYETNNSIGWYLGHFNSHLTGYILYDLADGDSLNAATSLAGILQAVAVDDSLESAVQGYGLTKVLDVRGKDDAWVWDNYGSQFTTDAIIMQNPNPSAVQRLPLREWGPAIKAFTFWNSDYSDYPALNAMSDNTPIYGSWVPLDEHDAIAFHGTYGLYTVATDFMFNLATHAGLANYKPRITYRQKIRDKVYTPEDNVHYVTFVMSDSDNVSAQFLTFHHDTGYFASPYRGDFAMGWGMAPTLTHLGPQVPAWYYREATENDGFIAASTGQGIMYPSEYPPAMLPEYCRQLGSHMEQLDLKVVLVIDTASDIAAYGSIANEFMNLDETTGMLYIDYSPYDQWGGQIEWYNNKPLVTSRHAMWSPAWGGTKEPDDIIAAINAAPTTPNNENGYSFVIVHIHSYGMDEVNYVVDNLDSDVRVVNPEEFIEQIYMHNMGP